MSAFHKHKHMRGFTISSRVARRMTTSCFLLSSVMRNTELVRTKLLDNNDDYLILSLIILIQQFITRWQAKLSSYYHTVGLHLPPHPLSLIFHCSTPSGRDAFIYFNKNTNTHQRCPLKFFDRLTQKIQKPLNYIREAEERTGRAEFSHEQDTCFLYKSHRADIIVAMFTPRIS